MLLTIDAGNTHVVFAVFDGDKLKGQWRIHTDARRTADEYGVWLTQVLEHAGIAPKKITGAILSSVVPQAIFDLRQLAKRYFNTELLVIGDPRLKIKSGIGVKIDNPSEVGADRLVNAFAAWQKFKQALIVVDFGTATTFDVVSGKGDYIGGVIAPGVNLALEALHRAAAKLPTVAIQPPEKAIGTNTVGAMQSGIYYGYAGLVEGIVARIKAEYFSSPLGRSRKMKVIATGGLASLYAKACPAIDRLEPDLTIFGLKELYEMNK
ncbi:MAG: type III pantothenate kinase [Pseudomonadota bacterium]|nr:type III pantothenate kinase [Pseudomonadota bacterium]MDE3038168.1 type III pantothenate kinase [Pseudomonadota bacterium]